MKNLKEPPTISTENKSKIMSKGNGITSIFERVFNRSHEESDNVDSLSGDGAEPENGKEISVYAEDHASQFGTVKVVGTVKTYGPEKEQDVITAEEGNKTGIEVESNGEPAVFADEPDSGSEVPQPLLEAYPFQTEPGVEGPPYTYIPSTEDMETQHSKAENEFENGDNFEHEVEDEGNSKVAVTKVSEASAESLVFSIEDLEKIESPLAFVKELKKQKPRPERFLKRLKYEETLEQLQVELVKLQRSVVKNGERVMVIFEGMDLAGKFGAIRKFTKHMDPRSVKVVSLRERTNDEKDQWYFQRYMDHLPGKGEIVFFNRSWYERGFIEPIHGHCTDHEYGQFLSQTPDFEYMLCEHGVKIIKIWLAVSGDELEARYAELDENPLMATQMTAFDKDNPEHWSEASKYRNIMFSWTDKSFAPWTVISADKRKRMQVQSMKHVLSSVDYEGKKDAGVDLIPDATLVRRFHRSMIKEMD